MQLGLAKRRLAKGEDVADLVDRRRHGAARGDLRAARPRARHPPRRADRPRPRARAARRGQPLAPLPVELDALPDERLAGPVEAAAYFTVSEALTNVARYAQATVAHVDVRTAGGPARDRGRRRRRRRGDSPGAGSGLAGLADRLGALGGELRVVSPPGEGTRLLATIPLDQPEPHEALAAQAARTGEPGGLRRRMLQSHAVVYALVMSLLVFIWLTTGGRLLLAAVGDRGLGTAARAPRLVRASASRGYARATDAS